MMPTETTPRLPDPHAAPCAVVTGASGGIGLEFARALAERGYDLVMVAIEDELLLTRAAEIGEQYGVRAWPLTLDLCSPDASRMVEAFVDTRSLDPCVLINNAGIFAFSPVEEMTERRIDAFIDLHVRAVTHLSRLFARRFARRGGGRILNMSSMSCWTPMPGIAMYAATKAYIRVFTRSLHYEMRDSGVSVTAACPGGIATSLFGLPDKLKRLAVGIGALDTPERFARKAVRKMMHGRRQYINGLLNRIGIVAVALTPTHGRMLVKRLMLDRGIRR